MTLGYRSEAIFASIPMSAGETIDKGDVVAIDANEEAVRATTGETEPVGVAAESIDDSVDKDGPEIAVVVHGRAGVTAESAVTAGNAVRVSTGANDGQVEPLSATTIDEGGTATHDIEPMVVLGQALEDIAADGEGDIFVSRGGAGVA